MAKTIAALFSEPFGQGYPKSEAARKLKDSEILKEIRRIGQVSIDELLSRLDNGFLEGVKKKRYVIDFILKNGCSKLSGMC